MLFTVKLGTIAVMICTVGALVSTVWVVTMASFDIQATLTMHATHVAEQWRVYLKQILLFSSILLIFVASSLWAATRSGQIYLGLLIVCLYGLALAISVIYTQLLVQLSRQASKLDIDEIKNQTILEFAAHGNSCGQLEWMPQWLKTAQTEHHCCGVSSFHDWHEFRPECSEEYPESCCVFKNSCVRNLLEVPWPDTLSSHIKTESCGATLKEFLQRKLKCGVTSMLVLTGSIIITLVAFVGKYAREFIFLRKKEQIAGNLRQRSGHDQPRRRGGYSISCLAGVWCRMRRRMTNTRRLNAPPEGGDSSQRGTRLTEERREMSAEDFSYTFEMDKRKRPSTGISEIPKSGSRRSQEKIHANAEKQQRSSVGHGQTMRKAVVESSFERFHDTPSNLFDEEAAHKLDLSVSNSLSTHSLMSEDDIQFINKLQVEHPVRQTPAKIGFPTEKERPTLRQLLRFGKLGRGKKKSDQLEHEHELADTDDAQQ